MSNTPEGQQKPFQYFIWIHEWDTTDGWKEQTVYSFIKHLELKEVSDGFTTYVNQIQHEKVKKERDQLAFESWRFEQLWKEEFKQRAEWREMALKLGAALEFYGDKRKYQGANQCAESDEETRLGGFRLDVTFDCGEKARRVLAEFNQLRNGISNQPVNATAKEGEDNGKTT